MPATSPAAKIVRGGGGQRILEPKAASLCLDAGAVEAQSLQRRIAAQGAEDFLHFEFFRPPRRVRKRSF